MSFTQSRPREVPSLAMGHSVWGALLRATLCGGIRCHREHFEWTFPRSTVHHSADRRDSSVARGAVVSRCTASHWSSTLDSATPSIPLSAHPACACHSRQPPFQRGGGKLTRASTLPLSSATGTGPYALESVELLRLSPASQTCPRGMCTWVFARGAEGKTGTSAAGSSPAW